MCGYLDRFNGANSKTTVSQLSIDQWPIDLLNACVLLNQKTQAFFILPYISNYGIPNRRYKQFSRIIYSFVKWKKLSIDCNVKTRYIVIPVTYTSDEIQAFNSQQFAVSHAEKLEKTFYCMKTPTVLRLKSRFKNDLSINPIQ